MAAPQQATTPARSRGFSVKSDRSRTSGHKSNLSESSQEKARRNLQTKADPLVAMNELQPNLVALEKSNLGSLREIQHKDQYGNPITDPDWSNPTRPRFERPLDTIRSFEAAIYGTYTSQRPASYARTDDAASQMGDYSRRTSYYGPNAYTNRNGEQNGNYGRGGQSRPDSFVDYGASSSQAPESQYGYGQNGGQRRPRVPRQSTDHGMYANGGRSYDNVAALSGSPSGSTDPYGQSTDPSSINSSNDQLQQHALQQRMDERGQAEYGYGAGPSVNGKSPMAPPPVAKNVNVVKKPAKEDKRKSWLKRRFSKD
ncbi:hypothetical protein N7493_010905 [Penicillium malachiteum]|uniref:Uncharacterized protein n=1 Tax=Penicillium malachiteum TaxID=1324776 RepID=A0AAD6HB96_9EURO|nr:hypothetical protein N7493_010905 [Penicillium malachiteum]